MIAKLTSIYKKSLVKASDRKRRKDELASKLLTKRAKQLGALLKVAPEKHLDSAIDARIEAKLAGKGIRIR